jgi:hypothetical protein
VAQQTTSSLGRLIVEVPRSHAHLVGLCEWVISSSPRPLPTQLTTHTRDEYPCTQRDSNPQFSFREAADRRLGRTATRISLLSYFVPVLSMNVLSNMSVVSFRQIEKCNPFWLQNAGSSAVSCRDIVGDWRVSVSRHTAETMFWILWGIVLYFIIQMLRAQARLACS